MSTDEKKYSDERIVGHHIGAWTEEDAPPEWWPDHMTYTTKEYVVIKEGDINWNKSRHVRLNKRQLKEIYEFVFEE